MADWQVEDHLIAFSYRIKPLKTVVSKLLDADMHVFWALWPDAETLRSPIALAEALMNGGARLTEWRYSAGRAGADEVLTFLLSWYETIDFDLVQTCRTASKFASEEEWVQRRKNLANYYIEFADVHTFIPDLRFYPRAAAEEEEAEGEEGEDEAGDEDAEDEGEEGAAETEPARVAETATSGSGRDAESDAPVA